MFEALAEGLYALISANNSCNAYLLAGEENTLIDTGLGASTPLLVKSLAGLGIKPGGIALILHTHGHADHFAADSAFRNAEIRMHRHDADYVNCRDAKFTCSGFFGIHNWPRIGHFLEGRDSINLGQFTLNVVHTPGHTKGSVCFHDAGKGLLFSGDTLFSGSVGRYDLQSSNRRDLLSSLKMLQELEFGLLLPGHGPVLAGDQRHNLQKMLTLLE